MEIPARRLVFRVHAAAIRFDSSPSETSSNQLHDPLPPPHEICSYHWIILISINYVDIDY